MRPSALLRCSWLPCRLHQLRLPRPAARGLRVYRPVPVGLLTRFVDHYLPAYRDGQLGGFNVLVADGAHFRDAHCPHADDHRSGSRDSPPERRRRCTGSSATGSSTGTRPSRRSVEDHPSKPSVEMPRPPRPATSSPLWVTSQARHRWPRQGRERGDQDRAAVPLGGHAADLVLWLDDATGSWVTSTYYRPDGTLPPWVEALNAERRLESVVGKVWEPLLPSEAYRQTLRPAQRAASGPIFSHALPSVLGEPFYDAWAAWGPANDEVLEVARRAIAGEGWGLTRCPTCFCSTSRPMTTSATPTAPTRPRSWMSRCVPTGPSPRFGVFCTVTCREGSIAS